MTGASTHSSCLLLRLLPILLRRGPEVFLHVLVHRLVREVGGPVGLSFQLLSLDIACSLSGPTFKPFGVFQGEGTYP